MAAYIKQLQQNGDDIYPVTKASAVYSDDGQSIDEYVKNTVAGLKSVEVTLSASGWTGDAAPYSYDLGSAYALKTAVMTFNGTTGTKEQYDAFVAAGLQGGTSSIIYAYGTKPTADIPVIVTYNEAAKLTTVDDEGGGSASNINS